MGTVETTYSRLIVTILHRPLESLNLEHNAQLHFIAAGVLNFSLSRTEYPVGMLCQKIPRLLISICLYFLSQNSCSATAAKLRLTCILEFQS